MNKKIYCLLLVLAITTATVPAYSARRKASSPKAAASAPVSINSLIGTWTASGKGTGTDPRQPGALIPMTAENVIFTVEGFKSSGVAGEETADVIFNCIVADTRGNVKSVRTWEYATPYDVQKEAEGSWSFSSEFLDGEDKVTVTLTSAKTAKIRLQCSDWNGDYADEVSTFDITCEAEKK